MAAIAMIAILMLPQIQPLALAARVVAWPALAAKAAPSLVAQLQTGFPTLAPDLATRASFVPANRVIDGQTVVGLELEGRATPASAGLDLFFPSRYDDPFVVANNAMQIRMRPLDAHPTPAQVVNLSGISAGPADENSQTLTVMAISSNPALIANPTVTYNSPNAIGTVIGANPTLLRRYSAADVRQRPVLLR